MTRLYINVSYTSPYFQRHKHILIQQRGILWSKRSCFVPYFEWKDLFQTLVPVEIGYDHLKQLQYDNATHFRAVKNIYSINHGIPIDPIYSKKVSLAKQRLDISWISASIPLFTIIISLYYNYITIKIENV
jgi:hypothetical protein